MDEDHLSILEESARATQEAPAAQPVGGLREKVLRSVVDLQKGLLERETEVGSAKRGAWACTNCASAHLHHTTPSSVPMHPSHARPTSQGYCAIDRLATYMCLAACDSTGWAWAVGVQAFLDGHQ